MAKQHYTYYFKNELNSVKHLKNALVQIGKDHGVKDSFVQHIRLSLEELLVNIISHGYTDRKIHTIELKINRLKNHFTFCLNSGGVPFNPLKFKMFPASIKERKPGGLGILLAKAFMDEMSYEYKNGRNYITLIKKIN